MKSRHCVIPLVIALLAGCQSLGTHEEALPADGRTEPVVEGSRFVTTLSPPLLPQSEPLGMGPRLPEPGLPAVLEGFSISEPHVRDAEVLRSTEVLRSAEVLRSTEAPLPVPRLHAFASASIPYESIMDMERRNAPRRNLAITRKAPPADPQPLSTEPAGERHQLTTTMAAAALLPQARSGVKTQPETKTAADLKEAGAMEVEQRGGELVARRGDPIAVDLQGDGWIFLGMQSRSTSADSNEPGVDFLSRQSYPDRTSFSFKAAEYGQYDLSFQHQDHQKAELHNQVVSLRVVPEQEFEAIMADQRLDAQNSAAAAAAAAAPEPGAPIEKADALFELGEYERALAEYRRNLRSGDPYLDDRLAACYAAVGDHAEALRYYRNNLGLEGEYGDRAALGMVRSSIELEDSETILEAVPSLFGLDAGPGVEESIDEELLAVARLQADTRHYPVAIRALERYVALYPFGRNLDEVYYRLAGIYEVDSPQRDLESARDYYRLLYDDFPESRYADLARERLRYLDRHFFLVQ